VRILGAMSVRPKDLRDDEAPWFALHCGECVVDYTAEPGAYTWMFPDDLIVCEGCGSELVLEQKTLVEA
jgi:hypothetical protein